MAKIKDGWHKVGEDIEVYVEDGYVEHGVFTPKGRIGWMSRENVELYRFDKKLNDWFNVSGEITLSALRAGLARGTIDLR